MATECTSRSTNRCFPNVGIRITLHKKKPKSPTTTTTTTSQNSSFSSRTSGSNSFTPRTRSREEELKDVFRHFDINQDGKISAMELQRYFTTIGEIVSLEEAQEVIDELDSDKDGMLEFDDFVKLMMDTKEGGDNDDLKKVFEMFVHEKGSGRITPRGLQRAMNRLGDPKSYNECVTMIQVYDIDGDGELDFNEFHHMMAA